jgi:hypothetical protein
LQREENGVWILRIEMVESGNERVIDVYEEMRQRQVLMTMTNELLILREVMNGAEMEDITLV